MSFDDVFLGRGNPMWHPFTPHPPLGPREVLARASGAHVFTESGHRLFDAFSSWWCQSLGHCHPRLLKAFVEQAKQMDQVVVAPHTHRPAIELSEKLLNVTGNHFARVFYSDDGSTAVEAALKMALQYQKLIGQAQRKTFVSMERAFHGDTLGAVSVSHIGEFHDSLPFEPNVLRAKAPYCYRCPEKLTFPSCEIACLASAEKFFAEHGNNIAALIVEPLVLGAAGMITYPKSYLEKLVRLAQKQGALVIFDEVFTGFGRLGPLFAYQELQPTLWPDLLCLSKGLTSGFIPFAATLATQKVYEPFIGGPDRAFYHGHTFTANPMACRVALEVLNIFEEEEVLQANRPLIQLMADQIPRFAALANVGQVRHLGMVWAIELVKNKISKSVPSPANGPGWRIAKQVWNEGVWLRPLHQMIYLVPPFCSTAQDLSHAFNVLLSAVQKETTWDN